MLIIVKLAVKEGSNNVSSVALKAKDSNKS
jgi:hypothetical protein